MPKKLTLRHCHTLAEKKNGKCLSVEYINCKTKILWECSEGHQWEAIYKNIYQGRWCPKCATEAQKKSLEDAIRLAQNNNGRCLSDEYVCAKTKMLWECGEGHRWKARYSNIRSGHWCPKCKIENSKVSLKKPQELADRNDGRCLSDEYKNAFTKITWECAFGHNWVATYSNVKQGRWCPHCNLNNRRKSIKDAQKLAKNRGGRCLSKKYVRAADKMLWECDKKHKWEASYNSVQRGKWCPKCKNKGQEKLYQVIKKIFPNTKILYCTRPFEWLKNPKTNRKLELDFFIPNLKMAMEYDGRQHFEPARIGGISEVEAIRVFKNQRKRDELKDMLISEHRDDVKIFIRFRYDEPIDKKYVINKFKKYGVLC